MKVTLCAAARDVDNRGPALRLDRTHSRDKAKYLLWLGSTLAPTEKQNNTHGRLEERVNPSLLLLRSQGSILNIHTIFFAVVGWGNDCKRRRTAQGEGGRVGGRQKHQMKQC